MDPFAIFIVLIIIINIALQALQFHDFRETRSMVIEALYLAIVLALVFSTDFLDLI